VEETFKFNFLIVVFVILLGLLSGCAAGPVYTGSENIGELRGELDSLRAEYNALQQNYSRLVEQNKRYADYYKSATDAVAAGLGELQAIGGTMEEQIRIVHENNRRVIKILQQLIERQPGPQGASSEAGNSQPP
jgi:chromosome segregation ATPase